MQTNPDDFLAREHAPAGSALYYATLFVGRKADPDRRMASIALHAFRQQLLDIIANTCEPQVQGHKINWWSDEIMEAREGRPRHPVSIALSRYGGKGFWRQPGATGMLRAAGHAAADGLASKSARERFCHDFGANCLVLRQSLADASPPIDAPASGEVPPPFDTPLKNPARIAALEACGRAIEYATLANPPPGLWVGLHDLCEGDEDHAEPAQPRLGAQPEHESEAAPTTPRRQRLRRADEALREALALISPAKDPLLLETETLLRIRQAEIGRAKKIDPPRPTSITPLRKLFIAWRCFTKAKGA